jgi:hypothetical protein
MCTFLRTTSIIIQSCSTPTCTAQLCCVLCYCYYNILYEIIGKRLYYTKLKLYANNYKSSLKIASNITRNKKAPTEHYIVTYTVAYQLAIVTTLRTDNVGKQKERAQEEEEA